MHPFGAVSYDVPSAEVIQALEAWNAAYRSLERAKTRGYMAKRAGKPLTSELFTERSDAERDYKQAAEDLYRALSRVR